MTMTMKTIILLVLVGYLSILQVDGFTMPARPATVTTKTTKKGHGRREQRGGVVLFMAEEEKKTEGKIGADGTYYDDEVEPTKVTTGISNSMKERLAREAATGLDPDAKQTNVLLYIIAAVAVLVLLGGEGILY